MVHDTQHPLAGKKVNLVDARTREATGTEFSVQDWWDVLGSGCWQDNLNNFACIKYASRVLASSSIPRDDEVVYGKVNGMGHLMHVSELGALVSPE